MQKPIIIEVFIIIQSNKTNLNSKWEAGILLDQLNLFKRANEDYEHSKKLDPG